MEPTQTEQVHATPLSIQSSDAVHLLAGALAKAQGAFPTIPRDKEVKVTTRDRQTRAVTGSYTYKYAPLETILEKTRKALSENGLCLIQTIVQVGGGRTSEVVRTLLVHSSGQWIAGDVPMFAGTGDNQAQAHASGQTYSRRYGVTMLLCVAADEDSDAGEGSERDDVQRVGNDLPQQDGPREPRRLTQAVGGAVSVPEHVPSEDMATAQAPKPSSDGPSPWGSDITASQQAMCVQRQTRAGLTNDQVLELVGGKVTSANIAAALAQLKQAADEAAAQS